VEEGTDGSLMRQAGALIPVFFGWFHGN